MILGFDTSGRYISAALWDGTEIVADRYEEMARGQAERLFPLLDELLTDARQTLQDLSAIGVGTGPGNFTGIRLAVSAARGLALSLGVPAVGVNLLEALALGSQNPVLACLDAPRDAVYVQGHGTATPIQPQQINAAEVPLGWSETGLTCIGSGAEAVAERLGATVSPAAFAPGSAIARIAAQRWHDDPARPAPFYLRAADAAPSKEQGPVILDHNA